MTNKYRLKVSIEVSESDSPRGSDPVSPATHWLEIEAESAKIALASAVYAATGKFDGTP